MTRYSLKTCLPVVLVLLWSVTIHVLPGYAQSPAGKSVVKCVVLISMKIKPYLEAVEGIKSYFKDNDEIDLRFLNLETARQEWGDPPLIPKGRDERYAGIAIGPEAVLYLKKVSLDKAFLKLYTMVLDPESLLSVEDRFSGIFLSIDPEVQIRKIQANLPMVKHLGIIYDPRYNSGYVEKALDISSQVGLSLHALKVGDKSQVPGVLRKNWEHIDALLMIPDYTVISSSLVKFIIKDGLTNSVPVIGYNRFFIQSGALMAFEYDYEKIGRDTAKLAQKALSNPGTLRSVPATFKMHVNQNIADQLGVNHLK